MKAIGSNLMSGNLTKKKLKHVFLRIGIGLLAWVVFSAFVIFGGYVVAFLSGRNAVSLSIMDEMFLWFGVQCVIVALIWGEK